jgi:anthranilate synthase/aminodeoxychorismate synthase-like glutamine amidotransferase
MILVIDNYDSFTYNIVQQMGELGAEIAVVRNDQMTLATVQAMNPSHIVISPGPGDPPDDVGISIDVIQQMGQTTPILGVCLGHQSIGYAFGGNVIRADRLMHGKTSRVTHDGDPLFTDVPTEFQATRYHSLIVEESTFPAVLKPTAYADTGEIMALRHREYPIVGVQFHPESILTPDGPTMLKNFLQGVAVLV